MDGILLVNKPADMTSFDVVAQVRKLFGTKKVGHAGTLDPFATGLLLLCLGKATRIVEYVVGQEKEYVAVMRLGEITDTQDCTGHILEQRDVPDFEPVDIDGIFQRFVGEISQIPPMFSAKKVGGKRLYQLARQGQTVERAVKTVQIHALDLLEIALPRVRFRVVCSKGTYIRTLAHDIGAALGCGAHLRALERTRIGQFTIQEAVALEQLAQMPQLSDKQQCLIPLDQVLVFFPAIVVSESGSRLLAHGTRIFLKQGEFNHLHHSDTLKDKNVQMFRVYSASGEFIAIVQGRLVNNERNEVKWEFQPIKVFFGR